MVKNRILKDIIQGRDLLKVAPGTPIVEAARLMREHGKGAILIEEKGRICGIFSERDMVCRVVAEGLNVDTTPISQVMSTQLVVAAPQDDHVVGLRRMRSAGVRHLPIVDDSRLVGLVSRRELLAVDIELLEQDLERREACHLFI